LLDRKKSSLRMNGAVFSNSSILVFQDVGRYSRDPVPLNTEITKPNKPTTEKAMMARIGGNPVPFPLRSGSMVG
jgi:hypothetical protein